MGSESRAWLEVDAGPIGDIEQVVELIISAPHRTEPVLWSPAKLQPSPRCFPTLGKRRKFANKKR